MSDRRATDTRRRLLRAGRRAFARRGLDGTNLREHVLAPAGVSVGSFYHQFEDKTDLLLAALGDGARALEREREALQAGAAPRSFDALAARFYAAHAGWVRRNRDLWRIAARERGGSEPRVRRFLARERARWVEALVRAQRRLARGRPGERRAAERARWMVRLAFAAADESVLARGGGDAPTVAQLVTFTRQGVRSAGAARSRGR